MTIEKHTTMSQTEVLPDGSIQIRFAQKLMDGDVELSSKWLRTAIPKGGDVVAQLAEVNSYLAENSWPAAEGTEKIAAIAKAAWS